MKRILFVSEAVTLAQVVRLLVLARGLDRRRHEVHFAAAHFDERIFAGTELHRWPIRSLSPATVERRVRSGRRLYGLRTLRRYLDDDRRLLAAVRPDLVVGDLRLSLSVAAPLAGVRYAALINAYWSPYAHRDGFPLPDHPIVRLLGERLASRHFPAALPWVFRHFAAPVNRLRRAHGLPPIGSLPEVLTHGDVTLFPDVPELVPTDGPPRHRYLGPLLWSPQLPRPPWWDTLDPRRPTAYVTMGSSGRAELLPTVVAALTGLGAQVLVATAGRGPSLAPHPHVHVADLLPGDAAARRADLVVSNGGSSTGYQALAAGTPVLGLASNLDQHLAMSAIAGAGAGLLVRAGSATAQAIGAAAARLLEEPSFRSAARRLAAVFARWDARARFAALVDGEDDAAAPAALG